MFGVARFSISPLRHRSAVSNTPTASVGIWSWYRFPNFASHVLISVTTLVVAVPCPEVSTGSDYHRTIKSVPHHTDKSVPDPCSSIPTRQYWRGCAHTRRPVHRAVGYFFVSGFGPMSVPDSGYASIYISTDGIAASDV
eukprot:1488398-Rhodomonas_salina.1